ncbi:MAG: hypothetical protein Q9202_006266 [Teloschistes flavicans]
MPPSASVVAQGIARRRPVVWLYQQMKIHLRTIATLTINQIDNDEERQLLIEEFVNERLLDIISNISIRESFHDSQAYWAQIRDQEQAVKDDLVQRRQDFNERAEIDHCVAMFLNWGQICGVCRECRFHQGNLEERA